MRDRQIIGYKLRNLRERAGLRTAVLAKMANCSEGHLRNIEGGKDQPGGILTWSLARALGVDIDAFTELNEPARDVEAKTA